MLKELVEHIEKWQQGRIERLTELHDEAGQRASGETISSLNQSVESDAGSIKGKITAAEHFGVLEYGRKEGLQPPFEPENKIVKWIYDKGLAGQFDKEYKLKSFAFAIAKKHAEEGSLLYRTGKTFNGFENPVSKAFDEESIRQVKNLTEDFIVSVIKSDILKEFKK